MEVSAPALRRNLAHVRDIVGPEARILPVVKTDAYGLGLEGAVQALEPGSPWGYGIDTVEEGRRLRTLGIDRPVLLLAPIPPGDFEAAVASRLRLSISSIEALRRVANSAATLGVDALVHVEVDTGMGRTGFVWNDAESWGPEINALTGQGVGWEGVFTHFLSAGDLRSEGMSEQVDRFRRALDAIDGLDGESRIEHLCNSAGMLRRPDLAAGLVRPGIFLYGGRSWPGLPEADPVLAVRARIVLVREVPEGTTLGYGATYQSTRPERWATLGIGYGDGIPRSLGNGGEVIAAGKRVPVIGRISMGMTVVDITDLPRTFGDVGDEVTLLGEEGGERISVEEIAGISGTIAHEVLTRLSPRLPRIWL